MRFRFLILLFSSLPYTYSQSDFLENIQPSIHVGYRCDLQKLDIFHNMVVTGKNDSFGMSAYVGIGQRNTLQGGSFLPQIGFQLHGFIFQKLPSIFPDFSLHFDASKAFLGKPFLINYNRYQAGMGLTWAIPRTFLAINFENGVAILNEVFGLAPYSKNFMIDYRFSLGLSYEIR